MKIWWLFIVLLCSLHLAKAQPVENIIIVTTDGLRWQEVFTGLDSSIANDRAFNEWDSAYLYTHFGGATAAERRQKLLPFFWSTVVSQGQLYGNRPLGSLVNNANPYWFSYPGYSELLTGHVDTAINSNNYPPNPNVTLLEFFNNQPAYRGKVAAFGAWDAFDRIINESRSGIPVVNGYDASGGAHPTPRQQLLNDMLKDSYKQWHTEECFDVYTHYAAMETLKTNRPKVLYIAYGETDEWAHAGKYRSYLQAAHQVDAWLQDLWNWLQSDPDYKNKTALLITTDHGRGSETRGSWKDHGSSVKGANETWFAIMAPGVAPAGEMKKHPVYYQQQLAQTMARLAGLQYKAAHEVQPPVPAVFEK
jgi:hypothetical protein